MTIRNKLIPYLTAFTLWIAPIVSEAKDTFAEKTNTTLNVNIKESTLVINPDYVWKTRDLQVWWDEIYILYWNDKVLISTTVDINLAMDNYPIFEWIINWKKYNIVIVNEELPESIKWKLWEYHYIQISNIITSSSKKD